MFQYICKNINKKPKRPENSQLLKKTWHVNDQIIELILEQCVANY